MKFERISCDSCQINDLNTSLIAHLPSLKAVDSICNHYSLLCLSIIDSTVKSINPIRVIFSYLCKKELTSSFKLCIGVKPLYHDRVTFLMYQVRRYY